MAQHRRKLRMDRVIAFGALTTALFSFAAIHTVGVIHEGGHRAVAERLTRAIAAHDAGAIRELFAPGIGETVVHDLRLGTMADRFRSLGTLREVRVLEASNDAELWTMRALFTKGVQLEHVQFSGDGVAAFLASPDEVSTEVSAAR